MTIAFVDTSGLLAVLDRDDRHHARAARQWKNLIENHTSLLCTNYVLVETMAVVQNRLGMNALRVLCEDVSPLLGIEWVTEETHGAGTAAVLAASRRNLSLVDCISFEVMRRRGISRAFAFDRHFREQGFGTVD